MKLWRNTLGLMVGAGFAGLVGSTALAADDTLTVGMPVAQTEFMALFDQALLLLQCMGTYHKLYLSLSFLHFQKFYASLVHLHNISNRLLLNEKIEQKYYFFYLFLQLLLF